MANVDLFEVFLLIGVVGVGLGGFVWAALKED